MLGRAFPFVSGLVIEMLDKEAALAVLEALPIPVIVKDLNHRIVFVNQAASGYFQDPIDTLVGKTDYDCFPAEHAATYWQMEEKVIATQCPCENEETIIGPEGKPQIIITTKTLVTVANESLLVAYFINVTAQRQFEEQLRQAQKMEAVGQLTGGIAHDFNNHLGGIIGSLGIMQKRIAKGTCVGLERYTDNAMASAQRAASLTHRLLAFSRRQSLNPKPLKLNDLFDEFQSFINQSLGPEYRFEVHYEGGLWTTFCDHHQLENAVLNLAINARDAMPNGGIIICQITNSASVPGLFEGECVCISIVDTGTGIAPEIMDRVIEPFFTTKPIGEGTGLGLSMVYGFVKQSNGHFTIESTQAKGTTVSLYLPRYIRETCQHTSSTDEPLKEGLQQTVMLVEDDEVLREIIIEVLEDLDYHVLSTGNGQHALELIVTAAKPVDLLLTDIGLPGINGRDLAAHVLDRFPKLKIMFITGYDKTVTLPKSLFRHDVEVMTKPFTISELASRVQRLLEQD